MIHKPLGLANNEVFEDDLLQLCCDYDARMEDKQDFVGTINKIPMGVVIDHV